MAQLSIDFESVVDVIDSEDFCENDSEDVGDGVKFSYVDDDGNSNYSIIWPFDIRVL